MASVTHLSPGVQVREFDLTNFIPNVGVSSGAFVGEFHWGEAYSIKRIDSQSELVEVFSKPSDANYVDWYSTFNFLQYTDNLNVVRAVDETAKNADALGTGVLITNKAQFNLMYGVTNQDSVFAAIYPGNLGNSLKVSMCDSTTYEDWEYEDLFDKAPGTSAVAETLGVNDDEIHLVVVDEDGLFSGTPGSVLEKFQFLSKASDAKGLDGDPIFYGSVINEESQYIRYLGPPPDSEFDDSKRVDVVTIDNKGSGYTSATCTFTYPESGTDRATGTVVINSGVVDPAGFTITDPGANYTSATCVFSDPEEGSNVATATVTCAGGAVTAIVLTNAGGGYTAAPTITISASQSGVPGDLATATCTIIEGVVTGILMTNQGSGYLAPPVIAITGNGTNAHAVCTVDDWETDDWGQTFMTNNGVTRTFALLKTDYTVSLEGGEDGGHPGADELIRGLDLFEDTENSDANLLFVGAAGGLAGNSHISNAVIQYAIDNIAEKRKDCICFYSPDFDDVSNELQTDATDKLIAKKNAIARSSSYAVMDSGWKLQYDKYNDKYRWIPLNADIAGLCAKTDTDFDPWYSPAGFTRGKIKGVVSLAFNPNKTSRDSMYKNAINAVCTFPGDGTVLYGDKTTLVKPSAFGYINVRRLFIVLEKAIAQAAKYLLFELNNKFTRAQFRNMVEPYLREVQGRHGIYDFFVLCDETNNTPEVIDRAEFVASMFIKPARSINFITLNFVAVRTGVVFSEVVGAI